MSSKLTNDDLNMIVYFHREKGDLTRWCDWENKKDQIKVEFPELIAAHDNLIVAKRTINAIVENISNDSSEREEF